MTLLDLVYLAPLELLALTAVALLLFIAFTRDHLATLLITLIGLGGCFLSCVWHLGQPAHAVGVLLTLDSFAYFYAAIISTAAFVVAILAYDYYRGQDDSEEFYLLLVLATAGCVTLVCAAHFAAFFLGLEILSVSLYAMIAYSFERERSIEAGIKYLVLAAVSSAFLVFGIALVYAQFGTLRFAALARMPMHGGQFLSAIGFGMILVGVGFKLALTPFHLWAPDVYEGASVPAAAFIATASKGAMVGVLLRMVYEMHLPLTGAWFDVLAIIAMASMLIGNLLALLQSNVKRILAYSSIGQLGYVLVAFLAAREMAAAAATYYVVAYMATVLGAFGVVCVMSEPRREAEDIADFHALAWKRPALAAVMSFMLLSLAGIPLTAGFIGKFYLVAAGVQRSLWALLLVLVVSSTIGLFYYLRIIVAMFAGPRDEKAYGDGAELPPLARMVTAGAGVGLGVACVVVLWLGVFPAPLLAVLQRLI